jgi:mono/diheme cytochrome c family protein
MTLLRPATAFAALALIGALAVPAVAGGSEDGQPAFTDEFMNDPAVFAKGKEIWDEQCKFCHGKTAYPGKAPKLKPRKYTPEFVFDRITKGFKGMPGWEDTYNQEERMSVTAFIMHKDFSN